MFVQIVSWKYHVFWKFYRNVCKIGILAVVMRKKHILGSILFYSIAAFSFYKLLQEQVSNDNSIKVYPPLNHVTGNDRMKFIKKCRGKIRLNKQVSLAETKIEENGTAISYERCKDFQFCLLLCETDHSLLLLMLFSMFNVNIVSAMLKFHSISTLAVL